MGLLDDLDEQQPYTDSFGDEELLTAGESREPSGLLGHTLDILSRPNYFSAAFFDTLASDGLGALGQALANGSQEFFAPKLRLSFSDLIKKYNPEFAKAHPYATMGLGFIGDVALDPTTYISFGTSGAVKAGGKVLSKIGLAKYADEFTKALDGTATALKGGDEFFEAVGKTEPQSYDDFIRGVGQAAEQRQVNLMSPEIQQAADINAGWVRPVDPNDQPFYDVMTELQRSGMPRTPTEMMMRPEVEVPGRFIQKPETIKPITAQRPEIKAVKTPAIGEIPEYKPRAGKELLPREYQPKPGQFNTEAEYVQLLSDRMKSGNITREEAELVTKIMNYDTDGVMDKLHKLYFPDAPVPDFNPKAEKAMFEALFKTNIAGGKAIASDLIMPGKEALEQLGPDYMKLLGPAPTEFEEAALRAKPWEEVPRGAKATKQELAQAKELSKGKLTYEEMKHGRVGPSLIDKESFKAITPDEIVDASRFHAGLFEPVDPQIAARATADKRILELIDAGQTELLDKGGLKFAGKTLISGDKFGTVGKALDKAIPLDKAIGRVFGVDRISESIKDSKKFEMIAKMFDRNFGLPEEYINFRKILESSLDNASATAANAVKSMLRLPKESLNKLGKMAYDIDDATQSMEKMLKAAGSELSDADAMDIAAKHLERANLSADERAAYMRGREILNDLARTEQEAKLLDHTIKNYSYRLYDTVKDAPEYLAYKKSKGKLGAFLGSSIERKFASLDEAIAEGFTPEMDFAALLALRAQNSAKAVAKKQFNDWVELGWKKELDTTKKAAFNPANPHYEKELRTWNRMAKDIEFMGNTNFPAGMNDALRGLVGAYDFMLRPFKKAATTLKPSFAFKQGISNSIQIIMEQGWKSHKVFNPLSMRDAATALLLDNDIVGLDTPWAKKILDGMVSNPIGEKRSIADLLAEAKKYAVITGENLSGEGMKKELNKLLRQQQRLQAVSSSTGADEGLLKAIRETAKWWNHSRYMEDFGRLSLYINGRKLGMAPKDAAASVSRALFDYKHGMSATEQQLFKRIIPFYSFQKFAYPFVARTLLRHPGRVTAPADVAKGLFEAYNKFEGGETLSDSERKVMPGYLMEQPHVFSKMNDQMKAVFKTMNNFSPLESLGMTETDEVTGKFDFRRSMEKMALAQLSPMLKLPLELMVDKNFFTEQAISEKNNPKAGKVGGFRVTPDGLIENMVTTLRDLGGLEGVGTDDNALRTFLKEITAFEVDRKGQVFMNPYLIHIATSTFPILNQIFRVPNPEKTINEKALDTFLGIGTQKVDLKQQAAIKFHKQDKEIEDLKYRIRRALIEGMPDQAEQARLQLQELLKTVRDERMEIDMSKIRGGGGL